MIDLNSLEQQMPLTITDFKRFTSEQIQQKRDYLNKVWLGECGDIIKDNKESIENLAIQNEQVKNLFIKTIGVVDRLN